MAEINLRYGVQALPFAFDETRFQILSSNRPPLPPLTDAQIGEALSTPIGTAPLDELIQAGDSVLIVVSDATRATASAQITHLVVRRLIASGVSPSNIAILFATGIHRPVTSDEKTQLLTPFITQRIKTLDHDAYDSSQMVNLGTTERGTPVSVNRALKDYRHVVVIGGIGFHYFAGFTGGRKSICPGLASAHTIEATHLLALDSVHGGRRAGVENGRLKGNAVHEECENIAAMLGPTFCINSVVDEMGRAVRIYAGHWRESHRVACEEYSRANSVVIDNRRKVVIASCGGSPYDVNLIQAHKALDMAAHACAEGGTIVLIAECAEGLGRPDFLKWFDEPDSVALQNRLKDAYEVNGQTAWALLTKAERYRVHLISRLPEAEVLQMKMIPAESVERVAEALAGDEGYILPRGAAILPRLGHE
jgi:lactate racemase